MKMSFGLVQDCESRVSGQSTCDNRSQVFQSRNNQKESYSAALKKLQRCKRRPSMQHGEGDTWVDSTKFDPLKVNYSHLQEYKYMSFCDDNFDQFALCDPLNNSEHNCYFDARPIIDAIWRGSLSFYNENFPTVSGLVAHLSTQACSKVSELARLLPELLRFEMLPMCDVWPRRFGGSAAGDWEIGLYFFPLKERDEQAYSWLVDVMIHDELALKAVVDNVELLVFTSLQLSMEHWRILGRQYLWGLFSKRKPSLLDQPEKNHFFVEWQH